MINLKQEATPTLPKIRQTHIKVTLEYEEYPSSKTLFKNQPVTYDLCGNILLAPILEKLSGDGGFKIESHSISYYSAVDGAFVFAGKDPIPDTFAISSDEFDLIGPL
jgi:hypothetical protein